MKEVYISGKVAGLKWIDAYMKFEKAEKEMRDKGFKPINPLKLGSSEKMEWKDYIMRDLFILQRCDAIYMLKDWGDSNGAKVEKAFAEGLGIEVMYQGVGEEIPPRVLEHLECQRKGRYNFDY